MTDDKAPAAKAPAAKAKIDRLGLALILIMTLVGVGLYTVGDRYDLVDEVPLWPTLAGMACLAIPSLLWTLWQADKRARGDNDTPKQRSVGYSLVFMGLLSGGFGGWGSFVLYNVAHSDDASVVQATVRKREQDRVRRNNSSQEVFYLKIDVDLATGDPGDWYLEVTKKQYRETVVGDVLDVHVGAGYFGVRYVESITVHPRPEKPRIPSAADDMRAAAGK